MVVVDGLHGDAAAAAAAVADSLFGGGDLQVFFDHAGPEVAAGGDGEAAADGEEEELEWLSNKDAFPAVETMAPAAARKSAAVAPRTKGMRRRRRAVAWSPPPALLPRPPAVEVGRRRCQHCGTRKTPQWREGPEGRATLCNACGVRYRSGRLVPEYRPFNSPTFSPELHSNRHRRVVEMRLCRESSATAAAAVAGDK